MAAVTPMPTALTAMSTVAGMAALVVGVVTALVVGVAMNVVVKRVLAAAIVGVRRRVIALVGVHRLVVALAGQVPLGSLLVTVLVAMPARLVVLSRC